MLGSPFGGAPGASGAFGGIPPWMLGMFSQNSGQQRGAPGQMMGAPMANPAPQIPTMGQPAASIPFAPQLGNLGGLNQLPGLLDGVGGMGGLAQMIAQMRQGSAAPNSNTGAATTPAPPPNGLLQWIQGLFSHGSPQ